MNKLQKYLKAIFGFSNTESRGFIILLFLAILLNLAPYIQSIVRESSYQGPSEEEQQKFLAFKEEVENTLQLKKRPQSFIWDPNKADLEQLLQLGLSNKLAHTILNYRKSGGRFFKKEDLKKVYGFDSVSFERLAPYVKIESRKQLFNNSKSNIEISDLNKVDSLWLRKISGIGSVLSSRIIKYRSALGGFFDKNQLYEVYGLDSIVVEELSEYIFLDKSISLKKVDINTAPYEELRSHPYINSELARKIVTQRSIQGPFKSMNELKLFKLKKPLDQRVFNYLTTTAQ